jgi:hypothetical protein
MTTATSPQPLTVPPPDELRRRILACEAELKARRLLRMSVAAQHAADARARRQSGDRTNEGGHAS